MASQLFRRVRPVIPSLSSLVTADRRSKFLVTIGTAVGVVGVATTVCADSPSNPPAQSLDVLDRARDALRIYYENKAREVGAEVANGKRRKVKARDQFRDFDAQGDVSVKYVLVGGGTATYGALGAILRGDPYASVLVVTEEKMYPYNRTPLSKEVWKKSFQGVEELEYGYRVRNGDGKRVAIAKGVTVEAVDVERKTIKLSTGVEVEFQKLLLATGGIPKLGEAVAPGLVDSPLVSTMRTVEDYHALKRVTDQAKHCSIIGAGFLGTELAVALTGSGVKTSLICPEPGVLYKILPRYTSEVLSKRMRNAGVDLHVSTAVGNFESEETSTEEKKTTQSKSASKGNESMQLGVFSAQDGKMLTERVVVCVGIEPKVDIAREAGLEIDERNGGIRVDRGMRADEDIYAAGDVASYWDSTLGRRRVEHWDHALISGKIAGENMMGMKSKHSLLSMYWCDLSPIGVSIEAVGLTDSKLRTVGVWNVNQNNEGQVDGAYSTYDLKSGVIWYLRDGKVVGALLWNAGGKSNLSIAKEAIASKQEVTEEDLKSMIPVTDALVIGTSSANS